MLPQAAGSGAPGVRGEKGAGTRAHGLCLLMTCAPEDVQRRAHAKCLQALGEHPRTLEARAAFHLIPGPCSVHGVGIGAANSNPEWDPTERLHIEPCTV